MADFEWLDNPYESTSFDAGAQVGEVFAYLNVWSDGEFAINVFSAMARQFQIMAEAHGWQFTTKPCEDESWVVAHFKREVRDG